MEMPLSMMGPLKENLPSDSTLTNLGSERSLCESRTVLQRNGDRSPHFGQFFTRDLKPRRSNAGVADANFLLHELDELDELRHGVHAQQWQEPAIKREGFIRFAFHGGIEESNRLGRESID